jgi:hypothetical protein
MGGGVDEGEELNRITEKIIAAAIEVHKAFGPDCRNPPINPAWLGSLGAAV